VTNDYNHWTEAHEALGRYDATWMSENYGLSATNGEIFDGVAFVDDPLAEPCPSAASASGPLRSLAPGPATHGRPDEVHLAHTLDKTVTCEGVESRTQASALIQSGCDELHGYLFARPMPLAQLANGYSLTLTMMAQLRRPTRARDRLRERIARRRAFPGPLRPTLRAQAVRVGKSFPGGRRKGGRRTWNTGCGPGSPRPSPFVPKHRRGTGPAQLCYTPRGQPRAPGPAEDDTHA